MGCNFYFSRYGVRVQQAPNTLIVWKPNEAHGTSLPNVDPDDEPDDDSPGFCQRVLAFVTSDAMVGAWKAYQAGRESADAALQLAEADDDGALFE